MSLFDLLFKKQIEKKAHKLSHNNIRKIKQQIKAYTQGYTRSHYRGGDSGGSKWPYGMSGDGRTRFIDHHRLRMNARDSFHDSIDLDSYL